MHAAFTCIGILSYKFILVLVLFIMYQLVHTAVYTSTSCNKLCMQVLHTCEYDS